MEALAARLLGSRSRSPQPEPRRRGWAAVLVSLFIGYHVVMLTLYNLPSSGLARPLYVWGENRLLVSRYVDITGNRQHWGMFAPNPVQENLFVRVLVRDSGGAVQDLEHDIYGRRRHPYVLYEHMGKVNQRLGEATWALRAYGAWVCREWERNHGGDPAAAVEMVSLATTIPPPDEAPRGFDPRALPVRKRTLETFDCDTTTWAQLPPRLRERHGFEPVDSGRFKPGLTRTWVDRRKRGPSTERIEVPP